MNFIKLSEKVFFSNSDKELIITIQLHAVTEFSFMCSDFDYNTDYPNIVFQNNKMKVLLPKKKSANPLKVKITPNNQKQSKYKPKKRRCIWDANVMAAATESVTKDEINVTEASKVFNVP